MVVTQTQIDKNMRKIYNKLLTATVLLSTLSCFGVSAQSKAHERGDGGVTQHDETVSAISVVDVEKLESMPVINLSNALQGMASGLEVITGTGGLGFDVSSVYIRGQRTTGTNGAIFVIDGIIRDIDDFNADEIESMEVLKDATAKILYGPQAANGVVLVRTKRGRVAPRKVRVGVEYGVMQATRYPKFLGTADYVNLYNEACANDGIGAYYSAADIDGYKNSTGENDLFYPSVDYYNRFVGNTASYRRALLEMVGGNKRAQYAVNVGYVGGTGVEKIGPNSDVNRLNIRANLDINVTDFLSIEADMAARLEKKDWGAQDNGAFFQLLSTLRPNEYPFTINPNDLKDERIENRDDIVVDEEVTMIFGTSARKTTNLYSDMSVGGTTSQRSISAQNNLGAKFDLKDWAEGLKAEAFITFDNYTILRQELRNSYPTYAVFKYLDDTGKEAFRIVQRRKLSLPKTQNIASDDTKRQLGWRASVSYDRAWNNHSFSSNLSYKNFHQEKTGSAQDNSNDILSLRNSFSFNKKYLAEVTVAMMGSNAFAKGHKHFFSGAAGMGWVISNEDFLRGSSAVNFLKLKVDAGRIGCSTDLDYFLFDTSWVKGSSHSFSKDLSVATYGINRIGNPDLKWEYQDEANVGLEFVLFDGRLSGEVNAFVEARKNIIGQNAALYPTSAGSYVPYENIGEVHNRGIDLGLTWESHTAGGFQYAVGFNATLTKNAIISSPKFTDVEAYRTIIGRPTSAIWGLESQGLFGKDVALSGHPVQTYSACQDGDIAYVDKNGDGLVDESDKCMIGQSFPVTQLGLHVSLQYKGFSFFALATSSLGQTVNCTNAYFVNSGEDAYSVLALDRYHPLNNPGGIQPRLTTLTGGNNDVTSSFWTRDGSFLRLKNVEFSYSFLRGQKTPRTYKVFVRGENLCVLSKIKDLDPECLNAGVSTYPFFRTVTGGLSFAF